MNQPVNKGYMPPAAAQAVAAAPVPELKPMASFGRVANALTTVKIAGKEISLRRPKFKELNILRELLKTVDKINELAAKAKATENEDSSLDNISELNDAFDTLDKLFNVVMPGLIPDPEERAYIEHCRDNDPEIDEYAMTTFIIQQAVKMANAPTDTPAKLRHYPWAPATGTTRTATGNIVRVYVRSTGGPERSLPWLVRVGVYLTTRRRRRRTHHVGRRGSVDMSTGAT